MSECTILAACFRLLRERGESCVFYCHCLYFLQLIFLLVFGVQPVRASSLDEARSQHYT